jgi:hypothetical protein
MAESLREVAEESSIRRFNLFGKQPKVVAAAQYAFEQIFSFLPSSCQAQRLDVPEGAQ